ncbi:TPA: leucine--tRNA ligase [Candidatus Uhrbacteria bacterium]|uniref:Leucine--tRNA ligase n=2 Tax=Candidatus Uhriibacteriota TaxID=1752732 RepID=A0A0G1SF88_9BACT|nr:MAG: Leucine-tRNA ligase [Candidatus Uhrbacteria bacterium GW2011_GWF2_46_218]KKU40743.1 MAG: Leucine-tRNA ligase [Candidatus Uhrbacteria bacterium GW2011_GWE2_46_68]HBK33574.1 leucine--tRNA ligase [Candidatus Uhrbacteria bacterium]HCB19711.1 leucine--tRNA ligase [Candidatus Uhrbacteria bacterium]
MVRFFVQNFFDPTLRPCYHLVRMYHHQEIETKWQKRWEEAGLFHAKDQSDLPKFYALIEFPYPSGAGLHIGHPRSYTALDVIARKRRMEGYNVLYPIGWDAFGLPTENYAIKNKRKPQDVTTENIATFKHQLQMLGLSFDWSREINTTDPAYYKWTQWMFLQFYKAGLAYKAKMAINWCPACKIGLANEEVVNGCCERCGGKVEKREKEQWMIAITKYADRLLADLENVNYLPKIKKQQEHWIGRSEGAEVMFQVDGREEKITVFTTRPDTLFGATYVVLAPEHPLVSTIVSESQKAVVTKYVALAKQKSDLDRADEEKEKTGVETGVFAINPVNNEKIPIWIADYVMMGYGTGAIMAVPAHDDRDFAFAKKYELPIIEVVRSELNTQACWCGDGVVMNSGFLDGFSTAKAKEKITTWLTNKQLGKSSVQYKLRDWVFSRQRYWGEPIPLVHCEKCGWVPIPEQELPLILPDVEKYEPTDTGESPLASMEDWVNTICPTCGASAKRETDTMPNWAGSSWYFLRYIDPHNDQAFADFAKLKYWMPVDLYNGGMEHTNLHLLYSRFWNKFLCDQGHVPVSEPYLRRYSHGLIMAEDGHKMSKSKGNVVNPDEIVVEYGADALRMYILFMGPFEEPVPWSKNGLVGVRRFLEKADRYVQDWIEHPEARQDLGKIVEPYLKRVNEDIEGFHFNTAVATFMELMNRLLEKDSKGKMMFVGEKQLQKILCMLCPFAPHLANELWERLGEKGFVEEQTWPTIEEALLVQDTIEMAVQVNGKVRATIRLSPNAIEEEAMVAAFTEGNVQKYLEGKEVRKVIYIQGKILNIVVG